MKLSAKQSRRVMQILFGSILLVAGGIGFNHYRTAQPEQGQLVTPVPAPTFDPATQKILGFRRVNTITELFLIDPVTKKERVVFTDSDETHKIELIGNLTTAAREVVAVVTDARQTRSVWLISTDGTGSTTQLFTDYRSPLAPQISPDGQSIMYVEYDPATEASYALIRVDRLGANRTVLLEKSRPIVLAQFIDMGHAIRFVAADDAGIDTVYRLPSSGGSLTKERVLDGLVAYDLTSGLDGSMTFVDGTADESRLFEWSASVDAPQQITIATGKVGTPRYDWTGTRLAFILTKNGQRVVSVYDRTSQVITELGQTTGLIGWLHEEVQAE